MTLAFPLRVKAVMIDLDGTLLDTIPDLAGAANDMLQELGYEHLDVAEIRTFVGKGIANLVQRTLARALPAGADAALRERALEIFERCYTAVNGRYTTFYPGVIEGLDYFRDMGLPLACVTNKSGRFTRPLLEMTGLAARFTTVVAGDTLPQKKPDPAPLLHVCRQFEIAPADMLMIGDSQNDIGAARAAGCPVFCVPYGYSEGRDVRELDSDAIVSTLLDAARLVVRA